MTRRLTWILALAAVLAAGQTGFAQESPSAIATRKKLKQKITVDFKDIGTKTVFDDIKGEMDKPVAFKIDANSGVSNNSKLTYKAKDKAVEEVLNELSDKYEFGWIVVSNPKDRNDGFVIIRKSTKGKERGYEAGKEPKEKSSRREIEKALEEALAQASRCHEMAMFYLRTGHLESARFYLELMQRR